MTDSKSQLSERDERRDGVHEKRVEVGGVWESARRVGVRADVDVLVCGGGPAGVGAALAAAREGARTLLVERWGMLGGVWTAGLLNPFFECMGRGFIVDDLVGRLQTAGAWRRWKGTYTFDVEAMKIELERMMGEAGVELLYYTHIADAIREGDRVRGVVIESKAGREAVTAKVVIDATGDGDIAARAGCAYELGRAVDGALQPMTLMFEVDGLGEYQQGSAPELHDRMVEAIERHGLGAAMPIGRSNAAPYIISTPGAGTAAVQHTHVYRLSPLDPAELTCGTIETRRQAHEAVRILRHVPGLEGIRLARTAASLGVREARRVRGRYYLDRTDLVAGRRFEDAVACCAFPVDIHEPAPGSGVPSGADAKMRPYEIPYRSLVPADVEGLLLAGRCISGSHEAHASYRVTGTAMATGQAAGLAAAWAAAGGVAPSRIEGSALRASLAERGARFVDWAGDAVFALEP